MTRRKAFRFRPRALALLALSAFGLGSACYSTVPHRAQVASSAAQPACSAAIADVFARSGFIQLPTPPHLSMFFGARMGGPYSSFLATGSGVGVTVDNQAAQGGVCSVTIEALSPDAGCTGSSAGPSGTLNCRRFGAPSLRTGYTAPQVEPECPVVPSPTCELSSAPGADNDAAVDELARRVQAALGPQSRVN